MSDYLENDNLIARWLSGDLTEEERRQLEASGELKKLEIGLQNMEGWSLPPVDTQQGLQKLKEARKPAKVVRLFSARKLLRVAAAVAALVICYIGWKSFSDDRIQFATAVGEKIDIILPDGSKVKLDALSSLTYSTGDWEEERTLDLSGQAYFKVEKGSTFIVNTVEGDVEVLGTQFNVEAMDGAFSVECYEGLVAVTVGQNRTELKPGSGIRKQECKLVPYTHFTNVPTWKQGYSKFKDEKLKDVINSLSRYYQVKINLPKKYANQSFTGSVPHGDLELALRTIFAPMEIPYQLLDDGTVAIP